MKSFIPLLLTLFLFSACGSKTYKHFDFEYLKQSYSWGTIAISTRGTSIIQDEQMTLVGSPHDLFVEFTTYEQVSGCSVFIEAIQLERIDKRQKILLDPPKIVELKKDISRSQASRFL